MKSIGILLLSLGLILTVGSLPSAAADTDGYEGRRLIDVLRELQERGLDLIFSSAVVGKTLRISEEPARTEPRALLDEILPPLGLKAEDGPSGSILIVPVRPDTGRLVGRILSVAGGRPIPGALVRLPSAGVRALTGADGSFEIPQIPEGTHEVIVAAPGFSSTSLVGIRIRPDKLAELTVELKAQPSFVTEVVVTPGRHSVVREEQASRRSVTKDEALLLPAFGGDVSRVVELLPGIAAPDSSAAFNVRGSIAQDVSLVLDGLELYDPFHLQSFQSPFSLIDSNVVDRIDFYGGGFTADFGDRHGGFVEVSTLVPGATSRGELELGTLNSRISYRAPLSRGKGDWLISARGWYPEVLMDTITLGGGENLDPRFGDLYAKAAFTLSFKHRLSTHGLLAYDRLSFTETDEDVNEEVDSTSKNGYGWLRLLSAWSPNVTSETVLSGGRIDRVRDGVSAPEIGAVIVNDGRDVSFFGLKQDSVWQISDAHAFKAGVDLRWLRARYRYFSVLEDDPAGSTVVRMAPDGTSAGVYAAHRTRLAPALAVELGARWDRQTYTNDNQLSPRFNAVWRGSGERSEVRLALGRFNQSQRIHELHVEDGQTEFGRAEVSEQAELSFRRGLRGGQQIRIDAYYRELTRLRPRYENLFEPIELFPETTADRVRISPSEARLQGLELLVRGDPARPLFWWVSYALSSAEDVIDGQKVPRSWDQTHAGKFLVGYRRDENWSLSLSGSVHTGWPTTPVQAVVADPPLPGERNSDRFAGYARLDLKARKSVETSHGRLWLTLEVINLTGRDNECCLDDVSYEPRPDGGVDVQREFDHWLGATPSFSLLWEF